MFQLIFWRVQVLVFVILLLWALSEATPHGRSMWKNKTTHIVSSWAKAERKCQGPTSPSMTCIHTTLEIKPLLHDCCGNITQIKNIAITYTLQRTVFFLLKGSRTLPKWHYFDSMSGIIIGICGTWRFPALGIAGVSQPWF